MKRKSILLAAVLLATFLLKLCHLYIFKDQVHVLIGDEFVYVDNSLRMLFNNMKPDLFFHGGLFFDAVIFLYTCCFLIGKVLGWFSGAIDFLLLFLEKPEIFYFIGRMVSVLASTAAIYLVYRLGTYLWDKKTGLLAALLFFPLPVVLDQSMKFSAYSLTNALIIAAVLQGLKYMKNSGGRNAVTAGFVFGLALAADYYALFAIPFFVLIFNGAQREEKDLQDILKFCITALIVFVAANPYFVYSPVSVWQSICGQADHAIWGQRDAPYSVFTYVRMLSETPYAFISIFCIVGVGLAVKNKKTEEIALLSFPVANIFFFSFSKIQSEHYIIHAMPFMALIAAQAIVTLVSFSTTRKVKIWLISLLFLVFALGGYIDGCKEAFSRDSNGARAAQEWIEKNIPKGSRILMQPRAVPFASMRLFMVLNSNRNENEKLYFSVLERYIQKHPEEDYDIRTGNLVEQTIPYLKYRGIQYIVLSDMDYDEAGVSWLKENAELMKTFVRFRNTWKVRVYKILHPSEAEQSEDKHWW